MFTKGQKKGTVRFSIKPAEGARKVSLAGNFNDWTPATMRKGKDGAFSVTVELPPGAYEYKFIVDEHWVVDPDNNTWAANRFGTFNSVAQIV